MSRYALADRWFDVYRRTSFVVDAVVAGTTVAVTRQPARQALLQGRVWGGTNNTGSMTLTGTVGLTAGVAEVLSFASAGYQTTTQEFSAVSGITTAGLSTETAVPNVSVDAVSQDGSPVQTTYVVAAGRAAQLNASAGSWPHDRGGTAIGGGATISLPFEEAWTPRVGDLFVDIITNEKWMMVGTGREPGPGRSTDWVLNVQARESAL